MKNLLLASTALVLSAGIAVAEVTVGADGRMGVVYTEGGALLRDPGADGIFDTGDDVIITPAGNEFAFSSRLRIKFTATGMTDGGLEFGGDVRADNAAGGAAGTAGKVFVKGSLGKLSMGDVSLGGKEAVGQVDGVGYTGLGDLNEIAYFNAVDEGALYEYSFGAATFYAGIGQINATADGYGIGMKYDAGTFNVAIGYDVVDNRTFTTMGAGRVVTTFSTDVKQLSVGAGATFGGAALKAVYSKVDGSRPATGANPATLDGDQYAISATGEIAGASVTAFYRDQDFSINGVAQRSDASYGFGAAYDLGGGAKLKGGIAHNGGRFQNVSGSQDLVADFGITLDF